MAPGASDSRADRDLQSVRSAPSQENSFSWLAGREVGRLATSRTAPIEASIRALTIHQPSRRTARPQIGHLRTRRAEAAANSFSSTGEASRGEPKDRRVGVSDTRDVQEGRGNRSELSWVNTQRDAIATDLHYARTALGGSNQRAPNLQPPLSDLTLSAQRSPTTNAYESRPPKICFKILFASGRGIEARGSEIVYNFLERIKSHHNTEVPSQHARMRHAYDSLDNWDLLSQTVGRAGAGK